MSHQRIFGVIAVLGAVLLTGCGSGGADEEQGIASLGETGSGASRTSAADAESSPGTSTGSPESAGTERPQLRLDSTDEERDRYWHVYASCLKDHGHRMNTVRGPDSVDDTDNSPTAKAAEKACAGRLPLQPPELDRDHNPDYDDDFRAYVKCLNREGLKVSALPDNSGWTYNGSSALSPSQQTKVDKSCTMEAFGGKSD
ncbi:hypothetical protein [Streptomyces canus]|uniref:hypothetical protein n=1 Tax=Streptomyces canus TaxID=58343 RepID=UPI00380F247C